MANNVRKRKNKPNQDPMGAQAYDELYPTENGTGARNWGNLLSLLGKYENPTALQVLLNMAAEFGGCVLIAIAVTLARALTSTGNTILDGFLVGVAYAGTFYFIHQWPSTYTMRRHLNLAISTAYVAVDELGFFGWLMYGATQIGGAIVGGLIVSTFVIIPEGVAGTLTGITVPAATTAVTSFAHTFGIEFLCVFFICFALLAGEFFMTKYEEGNASLLGDNYQNGARLATICTLIFCAVFFPIQVYTFGPTVYLGGAFAGANHIGNRDIVNATQFGTTQMATSVFTNGSAWAHYVFTPVAAGLAAGLVFWLIFSAVSREWLQWRAPDMTWSTNMKTTQKVRNPKDAVTSVDHNGSPQSSTASYIQHVTPAGSQTRIEDLSSPYHKMK